VYNKNVETLRERCAGSSLFEFEPAVLALLAKPFFKRKKITMPTNMKSGLSGGAASNNINVVQMHLGRTLARYTDRKAGAYAARAVLSRLALSEFAPQDPWTLATS
jgi:hypothetical protein